MRLFFLFLFIFLSQSTFLNAIESLPKYGSEALPLSKSHEYFKNADAVDYWALIPYYVPQMTDKSCSIATITMLINALKSDLPLSQSDELATHNGLLIRVKNELLQNVVGPKAKGIPLVKIQPVIEESLKAFGIKNAKISVTEVNSLNQNEALELHKVLVENEKSANSILLVNFNQGVLTGDISVGHWSPVAAYDEINRKVLILDPDRTWFEPYWVSEEILLKAMGPQVDGSTRGYILVEKN